jgi:hypothetical protein
LKSGDTKLTEVVINNLPVKNYQETKTCNQCKLLKPIWGFFLDKNEKFNCYYYSNKCLVCLYENKIKWNRQNKDKVKIQNKKSNQKRKINIRVQKREYRAKVKAKVFNYYKAVCSYCGESRVNCLVVDHVNNNGIEERKVIKNNTTLYNKIIKEGFPKSYQILCRNCNWKKFILAIRNSKSLNQKLIKRNLNNLEIKNTVFTYYGGTCKECNQTDFDTLQVDHIDNNGNVERKEKGGVIFCGIKIYKDLIKRKFPNDYQILCCNCNWNKYIINKKELN